MRNLCTTSMTYLDTSNPELLQGAVHLGGCLLKAGGCRYEFHQQGIVIRCNHGARISIGRVQTDAHTFSTAAYLQQKNTSMLQTQRKLTEHIQ